MSPLIILSAAFLVTAVAAQGNEGALQRERAENEDKNRDEQVAYESFGSPVYGTGDIAKSSTPKSGYNAPVLPALPAAYSAYLNGLGYGSPYGFGSAYNRFGMLPYTAPYYGYGGAYGAAAPYNALGLGYGVAPGYGYGAGLPYTSPLLGRAGPAAAYNAYGYGGFPYAGLGYRFGGLGFNGAALGYNGAALRAPVAGGLPAPVAAPVPAPLPAPLPAAPAFRPPVLPTQGKDGSLRYAPYPPVAGQRLVY